MLGIWTFSPQPWIYTFLTDVATWASISLPLSFLLALWLAWARRGRVGELMAELGELPAPEKLEYALARALGDASLTVGRWDPGRRGYVTAGGEDLELPPEGGDRVVTFLEQEGTPLAAVVHDAALLEDRPMLDSVTAAARLAVDNERLQAELRAQLEEVRASRLRILAAADVGRRRVERDLHDGAQQRLVSIALAAKMLEADLRPDADPALKASLRAISDELAGALEELRELARGIHPSVLTDDGLGPALQSLADRSAVPARIVAAPNCRFPAPVEAAVYFVVAEALANAGKHAHASHVTMGVSQANGRLLVEVADDGVGGADPGTGSGLSGLADRVAAVDGQLEVESAPGSGTRVLAEIPCASS
jgi:signal transduction histidine kinase